MSRFLVFLLFIGLFAEQALALDFTSQKVVYSDASSMTVAEAAAVNMLTNLGIVHGNPDGTFAPKRTLNRAEFLKIVFAPGKAIGSSPSGRCFPDLDVSAWYAPIVCSAKRATVTSGYPDGLFHAQRPVNYAEAIKMLVLSFPSVPLDSRAGDSWFSPYVRAARDRKLLLPDSLPLDSLLTRGQIARLTAAFQAEQADQLVAYRQAESGILPLSSSTSSVTSSVSVSSSSSSLSSSISSVQLVQTDPLTDTAVRSQFILLGETSPILGTFSLYLNEEPFDVTSISVNLVSAVSGIDYLIIYDFNHVLIGRAYIDGASRYTLTLPSSSLTVEQKKERKFYIRASMLSIHQGAMSDALVQIESVSVKSNGIWSSSQYQKALTGTFPVFKTARSVITSVTNAGSAQDILISGSQRQLANFKLVGRTTDGTAVLKITDLVFEVAQAGGVVLSNVRLAADGVDFQQACTVSPSAVTCSSIPAGYTSLEDGSRTIILYGDITIPDNTQHASLRLSLNQAGVVGSPGAITWTDGSTLFSWVQFTAPIAEGTLYKY